MGSPEGLAFDGAGNLYTTGNGWGGTVNRISTNGTITRVVTGVGGSGLAIAADGNLYVAGWNSVFRVTPAGAVSTFATGFNGAWGLAFDPSGNLFVAEYIGNTIDKITPGGAVSLFATGLNRPTGLAFDSLGNLYVCNITESNPLGYLSRITPDGTVSTFATGFDYPTAIAIQLVTNSRPSIIVQPISLTNTVGSTAVFNVTASGAAPLIYQWSFNGTNIVGATDPTLTLANVQLSQAGNYSVLVTNAYGSVLSSNAVLTVNLPQPGVPVITSFSPQSGPVGTVVNISGLNFDPTPGNNIVYFGAVRAVVMTASVTNLTVPVPVGATYAPITETMNGMVAYANTAFEPTFLGDGSDINPSSFAPRVDLTGGSGPVLTMIADLDGDGKPDLVVANYYDGNISLFRNISTNGTLSFGPRVDLPSFGGTPWGLAVADVDGDGKLDLVVSDSSNNRVLVCRNISTVGTLDTNSFAAPVYFSVGTDPRAVRVGDLDGDGRPDIVCVNCGDNTLSILRNIGTAGSLTANSFASQVVLATGPEPHDLVLADVDGDGKPDLVQLNYIPSFFSVFRNASVPGVIDTNSFAARVDFATSGEGNSIIVGDVDGDGKPDVIVGLASGSAIAVYRNLASPGTLDTNSFAPEVDFPAPGLVRGLAMGDLNGDGKPDIGLVGEEGDFMSVYQNVSTPGSFTNTSLASRVDYSTGSNPQGVTIGDLDGDGRPDVVFGNFYTGTISIYQNEVPFGGTCTPAPSGLVSWWPAEGNANDVAGANNGTLVNGVGFATGEVGQAFSLSGSNYVSVPDAPALNPTNAITVECWLYRQAVMGSFNPVVKKSGTTDGGTANGYSLEFDVDNILFWIYSSSGGWCSSGDTVPIQLGQWYHIAGVYDGEHLLLYTNGQLAASSSTSGSIVPSVNTLRIGSDPTDPSRGFMGLVDEVSIYNRALTASEIQAIYAAGRGGKCPLTPPTIVTQPTDQTVTVGGTASFNVAASGAPPLSYQWNFKGTNIVGATDTTLTLTNVQASQAGSYSVLVTNLFGSILSSNAVLTVTLDHFAWNLIPTPRYVNTPFSVVIQAQDMTNGLFTNFTGTAILGTTSAITVAPPVSGNFIQGVWTGAVVISQTASNLVLRADDGLGHFGLANPIDVLNPPTLGMLRSGSIALYMWPVGYPGFVLETSDSLSPSKWVVVPYAPIQFGDEYLLPLDMAGTNGFYRLRLSGP